MNSTIIEHKNWDPKVYNEKSDFQRELAWQFINKHAELKDEDSILDIGCGDGFITLGLANKVKKRVVGIDLSKDMVEFANKQASEGRVNNIEFLEHSAEDFSLGKFSKIFSFNCLHWVQNQLKVLQNIKLALEDSNLNSRAYLLIPVRSEEFHNAIDAATVIALKNNSLKYFKNPRKFLNIESYKKTITESGLVTELIESNRYFRHFHTREALSEFIAMALPQVRNMSETQKQEFMNDLMDHYLGSINAADRDPPKLYVQIMEVIVKLPEF